MGRKWMIWLWIRVGGAALSGTNVPRGTIPPIWSPCYPHILPAGTSQHQTGVSINTDNTTLTPHWWYFESHTIHFMGQPELILEVNSTLAGVAKFLEHQPSDQRIRDLISGQVHVPRLPVQFLALVRVHTGGNQSMSLFYICDSLCLSHSTIPPLFMLWNNQYQKYLQVRKNKQTNNEANPHKPLAWAHPHCWLS